MIARLVGALVFTYFVSRLLLKRRVSGSRTWALVSTHASSLALILVVLLAVRLPLARFDFRDYAILPPAEFFWLCLDGLRRAIFRGRSNSPHRTA